jgi:flagellar protein FliS
MYATSNNIKMNKINPYLMNEILEASPQKLLLKVYDYAIAGVQAKNLEKTNKAISLLIEALNFEDPQAKEISITLYNLYQFCQEQMRQKNYDIVYKILSELRDTWIAIFNKK